MKKLFYSALIYFAIIAIARLCFLPEKFLYGHRDGYGLLDYAIPVIAIPLIVGFVYFLKTSKRDRSIGLGFLYLLFGFLGLIISTFIEKGKIVYELNKDGIETKGIVDFSQLRRTSGKSGKRYYEFFVRFTVKGQSYSSLPGSTDKELYFVGDTIAVKYLERDPFLNKIYYKEE